MSLTLNVTKGHLIHVPKFTDDKIIKDILIKILTQITYLNRYSLYINVPIFIFNFIKPTKVQYDKVYHSRRIFSFFIIW